MHPPDEYERSAFAAEFYDHIEPYRNRADIEFYVREAREAGGLVLELGQTFGLVTTPFRPFQHLLTVADQMACLQRVHRHLKPGGRLILDIFDPSLEALTRDNLGEEHGEEPEFTLPDGRRVTRWERVTARDLFRQVLHVELVYYVAHPDGRQERLVHAIAMRYLFRYEAEHLLARCGFAVEAVYADYDRSPYGSVYPGELIFLARKLGPSEPDTDSGPAADRT